MYINFRLNPDIVSDVLIALTRRQIAMPPVIENMYVNYDVDLQLRRPSFFLVFFNDNGIVYPLYLMIIRIFGINNHT